MALRDVAGAAEMWDLTISQVHTFAVGDGAGAFVVHNCPLDGGDSGDLKRVNNRRSNELRSRDAMKQEKRQLDAVAQRKGIDRRGFGDFIEAEKADELRPNDYTYPYREWLRKADRYVERFGRDGDQGDW